ncbi:MAG: tetratricopeptide repeat protein [Anaerolineae bacterium]|nr:tetratricopeptide repeat protein [Anaerolineae bacterium]
MTADFIIDVSETNFQQEVLAYSQSIPVVVDYWAEWCLPCKTLGPILEKLAEEGQGAFRLAKLNVDENPRLAQLYNISSIPAIKAFHGGKVTAEFTGLRPEPEIRQFLRALAPNPGDLAVEKGSSLYREMNWPAAAAAFRSALESDQDRGDALLGLAKCELAQGNISAAAVILTEFPPSKEFAGAERLRPLAESLAALQVAPQKDEDLEPDELTYQQSLRLVARGNFPAALDGLLEILRQDKDYLNGQVKKAVIAILDMMDEQDSETRTLRSEFSSILF